MLVTEASRLFLVILIVSSLSALLLNGENTTIKTGRCLVRIAGPCFPNEVCHEADRLSNKRQHGRADVLRCLEFDLGQAGM